MAYLSSLEFNPKDSTKMHIDLNSCFAAIEQQANLHLRGRPIAVAAYDTPSGCIVASSVEAKRFGVKVGMRVKDGKLLCPDLIVLTPDPNKYRYVHLKLRDLLLQYTNDFVPKSIDEFILNFEGAPSFKKGMFAVGKEIKRRIKGEIGDWLTVSIGIAPNNFLAKTASNLHKPDGLDEINRDNFLGIYKGLELMDLSGIKRRNAVRLNNAGVYTVLDLYNSSAYTVKRAFESVVGYYWYLRLRGWEIDDVVFGRKSFGNSYALPMKAVTPEELSPILMKLVEKAGFRLRKEGYKAKGVHVAIVYRDRSFWHQGVACPKALFDSCEIYKKAFGILLRSPYRKPVRELSVSCFNLVKGDLLQLDFFDDVEKRQRLVKAVDNVNERWGNLVITPAKMLGMDDVVLDRIAFGGVKDLEELL